MVLRKRRPEMVNGVPPELLDRNDPVWQSDALTSAWAEAVGVQVPDAPGPLSRHRAAARAWALSCGWVRYYGSNPRPFEDKNRLAAAGIPTSSSAAETAEGHGHLSRAILSMERTND